MSHAGSCRSPCDDSTGRGNGLIDKAGGLAITRAQSCCKFRVTRDLKDTIAMRRALVLAAFLREGVARGAVPAECFLTDYVKSSEG